MTDDLYDRLRAADPAPGSMAVEAADSPRTRALMEAAMSTQIPTDDVTSENAAVPPRSSSRWMPFAVAASAAGVILAGALLVPDMLSDDPATGSAPGETLALAMPSEDPVSMSCAMVTPEFLQALPVAFAGTATEVTSDSVTLSVDDWYQGGDAATVELSTPPAASVALLGYGIDFEQGGHYLISADRGTVSVCGFSGEATPELQAVFDAAYGG